MNRCRECLVRWSASFLLVLAVPLLHCGGGGGSPTQPLNSTASLSIGIGNADIGSTTILAAQLSLDGSVVTTFTSSGGPTEFATLIATVGIGRGTHTLAVTITGQTSSPNRYTTVGGNVMVFDASGNVLRNIDLEDKTATLATGESISYTFSV